VKEKDVVQLFLGELESALPSTVTVRTAGGDETAGPPVCILNWNSRRLRENGANPYAGVVRDEYGDATGREFHRYHRMECDVVIRTYDEGQRDEWLSDAADHFLPFEYDASDFNPDTTEWEVGDAEPRSNPVVEPDWYESGVTIRFVYVSRVEQEGDTIRSVPWDVVISKDV